MADINLTQAEAIALMSMEKRRTSEDSTVFPPVGRSCAFHYRRRMDGNSSS